MSDRLELYHNDMSVCAQKVRMVLAEKSLEWDSHHLDLRAGDQFKPEFIKLNPKAIVPVLVHKGRIILESNAIIEYLDEVYPDVSLMPTDAASRAILRKWLIQLDAGLHKEVAVISFCITFRSQILQSNDTPEALEAFYARIPDKGRAALMRDMIENGLESKAFGPAILAYDELIVNMDEALSSHLWLVNNELSLADFAYAPYITRLAQLQLNEWWQDRPNVCDWFKRIQNSKGYKTGLLKWNNSKYQELMQKTGISAWPHITGIIGEVRNQ